MKNENSEINTIQLPEKVQDPFDPDPSQSPRRGEVLSQKDIKARFITANPKIYRRIKDLQEYQRKNPTKSEMIIWSFLRNRQTGHKIRRQHIIDRYIVDFVCLRKKLVIEIDGKIHLKQRKYDKFRTSILNESGFKVIRFTNDEIINDSETVALQIKEKLDSIS